MVSHGYRVLACVFAAVLFVLGGSVSASAQTVTGTGTTNRIPRWTSAGTIGNSSMTQSGSNITVAGGLSATSFTGNGAGLTNVNATALGGFSSSAFAQLGAPNNFSGNQSITGSLGVSAQDSSATITVKPNTVTSVSATCNPTSIASGQTSQCTGAVSGTGNFSSTVTWTAGGNRTIDPNSGLFTAASVTVPTQVTITATSTQDTSKTGSTVIPVATSGSVNSVPATLHAIGGATSQTSSYAERRLPQAGDSILVTGPMLWDAPLPDGIHNIVLNGANASWQIAPDARNLSVHFGSTGIDAVGAACGGTVDNPGDCANMFGFTVLRAANPCLNLTTPAGTSSTVLGTVDNVSPIYIRFQPEAGCANLTLKNVVITNLGGDSSNSEAHSGIVFMPCCSAVDAAVDVENVQVRNYYRLFWGGADWTDSNSSFKWYAVTSYGSRSRTYGAITMFSDLGFHTLQVYDATDSKPQANGYYFYTFEVGSGIDIQRPFVAGSTQWKRGVYHNEGTAPGSGGNILRDVFCLNYTGSSGSESCMFDAGDNQYGTSVDGMVATGNYETLALRPLAGRRPDPDWTNFWLSEDGTEAADQGVVFIGGGLPHVHHGVVVVNGPGKGQIGVFAYNGAQPSWDHLTTVGLNTHGSWSSGMLFGESGFVVKNANGNSNIVMGFDFGILDCNNLRCRGTTYRIDPIVEAGVHHNDVWDADSGRSYFYSGGAGFENANFTPHPNSSYGDLTVNPSLTDTSRNPFTFDHTQLHGDGSGSTLIALAASRWRSPVGTLNPTQPVLGYLLQGFTPALGNAVCTRGYRGTHMGAVPCI